MLLDKLDQKLIHELFHNARTPNSELAKKLLTSKEVIHYRLSRLYEQGIIKKCIPIINYSQLGYTNYRIQLKFTHKNIRQVIQFFQTIPQTSWIVELQGNWDIVVIFPIKQNQEIFQIINQIKTKFQETIQQMQLTIVDAIYYCSPDYLNQDQKKTKDRFYYTMKTQPQEPFTCSKVQQDLLIQLQQNARESLLTIAKNINTSSTNLQHHLKQLLDKKIILGFIPIIDHTKLEYTHFKLTLTLVNPAQTSMLKEQLLQLPNVIYVTESYGHYDLEFECIVKNINHLFTIINSIQETIPFKSHEIIYNNKEIAVNEMPQ